MRSSMVVTILQQLKSTFVRLARAVPSDSFQTMSRFDAASRAVGGAAKAALPDMFKLMFVNLEIEVDMLVGIVGSFVFQLAVFSILTSPVFPSYSSLDCVYKEFVVR